MCLSFFIYKSGENWKSVGNRDKLGTEDKAKNSMGKLYIGCTFETSRPIFEGGEYQDQRGERAPILMNRQVGKLRCPYLDSDLKEEDPSWLPETYMIFLIEVLDILAHCNSYCRKGSRLRLLSHGKNLGNQWIWVKRH